MSKAGKIISRVGGVLLALTVVPNILYNSLLYIVVDLGLGDNAPLWGEEVSIPFIRLITGAGTGTGGGGDGWKDIVFSPQLRLGVIAYGLVALSVIVLLAAAIVNAASGKALPTLIITGAALALLAAGYIVFGQFAQRLMSPEFSLISLFGENTLLDILGMFVQPSVQVLRLGKGIALLALIEVAFALWTTAFWVTGPGKEGA
ncbi:MAG: hypothetical protein FWH26_03010 [Oscillospiraceae bacterium]|nr:hypothetical protein [Oscillospiraceae bacterium]